MNSSLIRCAFKQGISCCFVGFFLLFPRGASADLPLFTPKADTIRTAAPTARPTATPKAAPTVAPQLRTFEISSSFSVDNGAVTVYWTDTENAAPYTVAYEYMDDGKAIQTVFWAGNTEIGSTTYANSFTTFDLVPGKQYRIRVYDKNNTLASRIISLPAAKSFADGKLTSSSFRFSVQYRYKTSASAKVQSVKSFVATKMADNIAKNGYQYGLFYRVDIPQLAYTRNYTFLIELAAANGYTESWSGTLKLDDFGNASSSYWQWDIMGTGFFDRLYENHGMIPSGTYAVSLYLDGQHVNTSTYKVD